MPPQRTRARRRAAWITLPSALIVCGFLYFLYALNYGSGAEKPLWTPPPRPEPEAGAPDPPAQPLPATGVRFTEADLARWFPEDRWERSDVATGVACAESFDGREHSCSVADGDTVRLPGGDSVRYLEVDTPELRQRAGNAWRWAPQEGAVEAWRANHEWTVGHPVRLYALRERDRYGRRLAYVFAPADGEWACVNLELYLDGHARHYEGAQAHWLEEIGER